MLGNFISYNDFLLYEDYYDFLNEALKPFWYVPNESDIITAIENRWHVGIYYEEENNSDVESGFRLIEPFVYGKGYVSSDGELHHSERGYIRAFVIRDTSKDDLTSFKTKRKSVSKTKHKPYWRLFRVDRIKNWELIKRKIINKRPYYNPNDKTINNIISFIPLNQLK